MFFQGLFWDVVISPRIELFEDFRVIHVIHGRKVIADGKVK